ncbi:MAG: substrate-binding domain-containing protein [Desulfohalobiaceae bacterium]
MYNLAGAAQADLVLFMAGNQFMLMPDLVQAFQAEYPQVQSISYQTLPPVLELRQILAGGAVFRGRSYAVLPDVYSSVSLQAMQILQEKDLVDPGECFVYLHNKLSLMVRIGNPKSILQVQDLGRHDVLVSQPNPEYEHIAQYTLRMYESAGGKELLRSIMQDKLAQGSTMLTTVHHRETPNRLLQGKADAGPVWYTEVIQAQREGLELEGVQLPRELDQRQSVDYYISRIKSGKNQENAQRFLEFIKSATASEIFRKYGFVDVFRLRIPDLFIMDAVLGMEGNGPASKDLRQIGQVLASDNAVALDGVVAHMMGLDPGRLPFLQRARELGLGEFELQKIDCIGEPQVLPDYKIPPLGGEATLQDPGVQELIQRRISVVPKVDTSLCTSCETCVQQCPAGALYMQDQFPEVREEFCITCFCCQEICPELAISLG